MRLIKTTFDTVTPESAAIGDFADSGWIDEEGQAVEPDDLDIEEYETELRAVVALSCRIIGAIVEPSCSQFFAGVWYTDSDPERNYATGEETRHSFHLYGFTIEEERAIFEALTRR